MLLRYFSLGQSGGPTNRLANRETHSHAIYMCKKDGLNQSKAIPCAKKRKIHLQQREGAQIRRIRRIWTKTNQYQSSEKSIFQTNPDNSQISQCPLCNPSKSSPNLTLKETVVKRGRVWAMTILFCTAVPMAHRSCILGAVEWVSFLEKAHKAKVVCGAEWVFMCERVSVSGACIGEQFIMYSSVWYIRWMQRSSGSRILII